MILVDATHTTSLRVITVRYVWLLCLFVALQLPVEEDYDLEEIHQQEEDQRQEEIEQHRLLDIASTSFRRLLKRLKECGSMP